MLGPRPAASRGSQVPFSCPDATIIAILIDRRDELAGGVQLFVDGAEIFGLAYGRHKLKIVATGTGENTPIRRHGPRAPRRG